MFYSLKVQLKKKPPSNLKISQVGLQWTEVWEDGLLGKGTVLFCQQGHVLSHCNGRKKTRAAATSRY